MSQHEQGSSEGHRLHGQIGYLQLPARDLDASAAFYMKVFGWSIDTDQGGFEAPGMIGQLTTDLSPAAAAGAIVWIWVDNLAAAQQQAEASGGKVQGPPQLDGGERWLVEVDDPAGNRIGIVAPARSAQPQTMIAVRDVEVSSRWYSQLLGFRSDHGGPEYRAVRGIAA